MDLHERFLSWLDDGASGPLARDVAIHASACAVCQQRIAALDALHAIDPGRAPLPPSRLVPLTEPGGLRAAGRFAGAAVAVTMVGTLLAVGAGQLVADRLGQTAPGGQVLDVTGTPGPGTPTPSPRLPEPTSTSAGTPSATATPTGAVPRVTPRPTVRVTPQPTPAATPTPAPTATPEPTPSASVSPTASPIATPVPPTTASPTAGATPTPVPSPSV